MESIKIKNTYWDIAADVYFPPAFDANKKYPAIVSAHPIGSCKEQSLNRPGFLGDLTF